ncbi:hypothetical protein AB0N64_06240 [Microbacterium sp. NPDC089318]
MSTRSKPMAFTDHSAEADDAATDEVRERVGIAIIGILRELGPMHDERLVEEYETRREQYPDIPRVTPQRVRTSRAALAHRGVVVDSGIPGTSALGFKATVWALTARGLAS